MKYENFLECIYDMEFNPNQPNKEESKQPKQLKYILEYCNKYYNESDPETIYHEWIPLSGSQHLFILEMIIEPYMHVIDTTNGNIVLEHSIQRKIINIEGVNK